MRERVDSPEPNRAYRAPSAPFLALGWLLLALAMSAGAAEAATYYVSPTGSDDADGLTPKAAWRSIDHGQPTLVAADVPVGARDIPVLKASHFPESGWVQIGKRRIYYQRREDRQLLGCRGTPALARGAKVFPLDTARPGPGDTVIVLAGVYVRPEDPAITAARRRGGALAAHEMAERLLAETEWADPGVVEIRQGGEPGMPLTFRGRGLPVVDAMQAEAIGLAGIAVSASHLVLEGLEVRRAFAKGAVIAQGKNILIRNCRIHGGPDGTGGVLINDAANVQLDHNLIYDFSWDNAGIKLVNVSRTQLHHNTILNATRGVLLEGNCQDITITRNIITHCVSGIMLKGLSEANEATLTITDNLLWGHDIESNKGVQDFVGFKHPPATKNIYAPPKILSYDESSPDLLRVHLSSPCAPGPKGSIGARGAGEWPRSASSQNKNIIINGSFEAGRTGWDGSIELTHEQAYDGDTSVVLDAESQQTSGYAWTVYYPLEPAQTYTLSFYAKAAAPGATLRYTIESPKGSYERAGEVSLTTDWKRYAYTFRQPTDLPRESAVVIRAGGARVWLDAVQLERGGSAAAYGDPVEVWLDTGEPAQFLAQGKPLLLFARNRTVFPQQVTVRLQPRGALHGIFQPVSLRLALPPGARLTQEVRLDPKASGLLMVSCISKDEKGRLLREDLFRIVVGPAVVRDRARYRFFSSGETNLVAFSRGAGDAFRRRCATLKQMGVDYFRPWVGPDHVRQALGTDRELVERALAIAEENDLGILMTLENYPDAALSEAQRYTPQGIQEWVAITEQFVKQFGSHIQLWEIINEPYMGPHINHKEFTPQMYLEMCRRLTRVIKRQNPEALVLGGSLGTEYFSVPIVKGILDDFAASGADGLAIHAYRTFRPNPDRGDSTYEYELSYLQKRLRDGKAPTIIGQTEQGWGNSSPEIVRAAGARGWNGEFSQGSLEMCRPDVDEGERRQCRYGIKMVVLTRAFRGVCYSWHMFPNLVRDDYKPSALLQSVHFMTYLLDHAKSVERLDLGPAFRGYLFTVPNNKTVAAIYPVDSEFGPSLPIEVDLEASDRLEAWDSVGTPLSVHRAADGCKARITLARDLVWLQFDWPSMSAVSAALHRAFVSVRPIPEP